MNCPNCGETDPGPGAFCMRCGAKLPALAPTQTPAPPTTLPEPLSPTRAATAGAAALAAAPAGAPVQAAAGPRRSVTTVRHISAGSVFKVTFVIYALLLGLFGCVAVLLPGLLGSSLLGGLAGDRYGLGLAGGGIVSTLVVYVLLVVVGAFVQGVVTAVAVLIYNLVAGMVGGVRVELQE